MVQNTIHMCSCNDIFRRSRVVLEGRQLGAEETGQQLRPVQQPHGTERPEVVADAAPVQQTALPQPTPKLPWQPHFLKRS
jgi:hypothetical protein